MDFLSAICVTGATNTGAVDPLAAVADLCEARNIWFRGCRVRWVLPFWTKESERELFEGIERGRFCRNGCAQVAFPAIRNRMLDGQEHPEA